MKTTRRIIAIIMCACVALCTLSFMVNAAEETGSITVTTQSGSEVSVAGKTFDLYKIFNATTNGTNTSYSWNMEQKDAAGNSIYYDFFYGENGIVEPNKENGTIQPVVDYINEIQGAFEVSKFATDMYNYIVTNNVVPTETKTAASNASSVVFEKQSYGYYLVYDNTALDASGVRSAVMLTNVNKNATIYLKAYRPTLSKQVLGNDGVYAKGTSATIGDVITFKLSVIVPDYTLFSSYTYKIEDTMDAGLVFDADSVVVTSENKGQLTVGVDYTIDASGTNGTDFIIDFVDIETFEINDIITITYNADFTHEAAVQQRISNNATLVYSNDPTNVSSTSSVSDYANVYSYQYIFTKFAQDTNGTPTITRLAGAEFELYKKVGESYEKLIFITTEKTNNEGSKFTYYTVVPEAAVLDLNETSKTSTLKVHNEGEANITLHELNFGGHLGDVAIFGLGEGEYMLKETVAPDGYETLENPFYITITDTFGPSGIPSVLTITGNHEGDAKIINTVGVVDVLTVWSDITNVPGATLPETGGMGTTLFTVVGIIMMAGALAFFTLRKRSSVA